LLSLATFYFLIAKKNHDRGINSLIGVLALNVQVIGKMSGELVGETYCSATASEEKG
jgi:hypothetical protein